MTAHEINRGILQRDESKKDEFPEKSPKRDLGKSRSDRKPIGPLPTKAKMAVFWIKMSLNDWIEYL